ncbi:MAG: DUF1295 domain-containing protein [Gammaproteobacteria bacterium]
MLQTWFETLGIMFALAFLTWIASVYKRDVSIVDSLWSLLFLAAALYSVIAAPAMSEKSYFLLGLVAAWALRLSAFLTLRNWGEPEDRRYREIRKRNGPGFGLKSLYLVFGLQALIAWIIFAGLLPGLHSAPAYHWLDWIGLALWVTGFVFETVADLQLYIFNSKPANDGMVLDSGLWRYSRHPNYFGEFLVWWGLFLMVLTTGAWWAVIAPLIMTLLLLRVSGVGLMEKGMTDRRPEYRAYIERTNAFFPGPSKAVPDRDQGTHTPAP